MKASIKSTAPPDLVNLIRPNEGRVSRQIFSDPDIYGLELERVFSRTWAYIGHESELKSPGDFLTNMIGEDPVIASRDAKGYIHVMLNACTTADTWTMHESLNFALTQLDLQVDEETSHLAVVLSCHF